MMEKFLEGKIRYCNITSSPKIRVVLNADVSPELSLNIFGQQFNFVHVAEDARWHETNQKWGVLLQDSSSLIGDGFVFGLLTYLFPTTFFLLLGKFQFPLLVSLLK